MQIRTQAHILAPIETIWRVFNDPDEILKWDASPEWRTIKASNDLRVGGSLQLRIEPCGDRESFDYAVTYTRIEPMTLIEWRNNNDDRYVRVDFSATDNGVLVCQTFDADPGLSVNEQQDDWQRVLDNFARHVVAVAS